MRLSDLIEEWIKQNINETEGYIDLQRNELANKFNCVPSQINYVITTRFNPNNGYYVESRRGGGGYIRIKKVDFSNSNYIMHIVNVIGDSLSAYESNIFINNLLDKNIITEKEAKLMKVATNDKVLQLDFDIKDMVRANILKNMLINLI